MQICVHAGAQPTPLALCSQTVGTGEAVGLERRASPPHLRLVHSSSFSASFRSTSALTWESSSWIRRVLVSSSSRAPWGIEQAIEPGGPQTYVERGGQRSQRVSVAPLLRCLELALLPFQRLLGFLQLLDALPTEADLVCEVTDLFCRKDRALRGHPTTHAAATSLHPLVIPGCPGQGTLPV